MYVCCKPNSAREAKTPRTTTTAMKRWTPRSIYLRQPDVDAHGTSGARIPAPRHAICFPANPALRRAMGTNKMAAKCTHP